MTTVATSSPATAKRRWWQAATYNPIASHGFCFLLGITVMAYSWPDHEAPAQQSRFKKGQVYLWLNPKHITLPKPLLPIPYLIARKLATGDACVVSSVPVTLAGGRGKNTLKVNFPLNKKSEALATAFRQRKPLMALPADHKVTVAPCHASVLRIEYGS